MHSNQLPRRSTEFNQSGASSSKPKNIISSNTQKSKQRDNIGKEWISKRRKEQQQISNARNPKISESTTDSTPCSRSESYEIYSSPVKVKPAKKEELDLEEEDSPPFLFSKSRRHQDDIDIIEESDSSQVSSSAPKNYANDINEDLSSPDFKLQQNRKKYDEIVVETSSDSDATTVVMKDEIEVDEEVEDSNPIQLSQDEAISEAMQYLSYKHNFHDKRAKSPVINSSPPIATKKKRAKNGNSFGKRSTIKEKEDSLNIEEDDDEVIPPTPSVSSESGNFGDDEEQKEDDENDGEDERRKRKRNKYHDTTTTTTIYDPDENDDITVFDTDDSDTNDEKEEDDDDEDEESSESEDENKKAKNNDPHVDFIKPDQPNTPKPEIISANILSTYTSDGLVYTELDNEYVIITPAIFRVKDTGTFTYEKGTGIEFIGPSIGGKPSRKFIACPNTTKDILV